MLVLFRLAEEGDVEASLTILLLEESIKYVLYILLFINFTVPDFRVIIIRTSEIRNIDK